MPQTYICMLSPQLVEMFGKDLVGMVLLECRYVSLGMDCEVSKALTHSQLALFPVSLLMSQDTRSRFLLHCHMFLLTAPYHDEYGLN